jgi:hypothetical protein
MVSKESHTEPKFSIVAYLIEHEISYNADERLRNEEQPESEPEVSADRQKPSVNIRVDEDQGFFRHCDLSLDEVKYLISKRYKDVKQFSIISKKQERFLLKPRYNEGIVHYFLVMEIYNLIKQHTDKVWLYETVKPDIIFEIDKKKFAIEIESGKVLKNNKRELIAKVSSLTKDYGENWFFVVSDKNLVTRYSEFGQCFTKLNIARKIENMFQKQSTDKMPK